MITDNAVNSPQNVPLSGTTLVPQTTVFGFADEPDVPGDHARNYERGDDRHGNQHQHQWIANFLFGYFG